MRWWVAANACALLTMITMRLFRFGRDSPAQRPAIRHLCHDDLSLKTDPAGSRKQKTLLQCGVWPELRSSPARWCATAVIPIIIPTIMHARRRKRQTSQPARWHVICRAHRLVAPLFVVHFQRTRQSYITAGYQHVCRGLPVSTTTAPERVFPTKAVTYVETVLRPITRAPARQQCAALARHPAPRHSRGRPVQHINNVSIFPEQGAACLPGGCLAKERKGGVCQEIMFAWLYKCCLLRSNEEQAEQQGRYGLRCRRRRCRAVFVR